MNNKRNQTIDIAKGILILLVVLGHGIALTEFDNRIISSVIYGFHMPAFFMISGYLHNQRKWEERGTAAFTIKRIHTLLIPYLIFDILSGLILNLARGIWKNLNLFGIAQEVLILFKKTLTLDCNIITSWYLPALFFGELLLYVLLRFSEKQKCGLSSVHWMQIFSILSLIISAIILHTVSSLRIFRIAAQILTALFFLDAGYSFRQFSFMEKKQSVLIAAVIFIVCAMFNRKVMLPDLTVRSMIVFAGSGLCGSYLLFRICEHITSPVLAFLGRKSLIIYGTHYIVRNLLLILNVIQRPTGIFGFLLYLVCVLILEVIMIPVMTKLLRFLSIPV